MRIIDAHIHIPREDPSGVGSLVRAAERNGIGALCFSSLGTWEYEPSLEACIRANGEVKWAMDKCTDPSVGPFIRAAMGYGVPVLQHAWLKSTGNLPNESTPQDVAEMASKYPDATIIMAHIGGNWEIGAQAVKDHRNVIVDTCGTICDAGMIEYVVAMLGAERVVYGSDNCDFAGQVAKIISAEIKEEEKELILSGNIERVMRI
jgi:predicted TIM-barrel fold metal-dependent hydrolase